MERFPTLAIGTRVRLAAPAAGLELPVPTGRVVRADEWAGHYVVELDAPARYRHVDGSEEVLREVREAADNLEVLASVEGEEATPTGFPPS